MSANRKSTHRATIARSAAQKITPFLWFGGQAAAAAEHYVSIFPDSRITAVTRYDHASAAASGRPEGSVLTVGFELAGQRFTALNGNPVFPFTEAVSFVVNCATQEEIDSYWAQLSAGGETGQCGWLKDKFGVSWQVVPSNLGEWLQGDDAAKSHRVMQALLQMTKLDSRVLLRAFNQP